jgi:hypothetical protein
MLGERRRFTLRKLKLQLDDHHPGGRYVVATESIVIDSEFCGNECRMINSDIFSLCIYIVLIT